MHAKICIRCNQSRPLSNFTPHKRVDKDGSITRPRRNICKKCERIDRINSGLCVFCRRKVVAPHTSCNICLAAAARRRRNRTSRLRLAAIAAYGGRCEYCKESRDVFLSIDHIHDDGAAHRRKINKGKNNGVQIYLWLNKHQYPRGFQVLCMNCNWAKSRIGEEALLQLLQQDLKTPEIGFSVHDYIGPGEFTYDSSGNQLESSIFLIKPDDIEDFKLIAAELLPLLRTMIARKRKNMGYKPLFWINPDRTDEC